MLGLVTKLLNLNPEYYTIWNHRRRVLDAFFAGGVEKQAFTNNSEDLLNNDLQLTFVLLRQFPKCYWIWNHRNWLLRTAEMRASTQAGRDLWTGELQLVNKMLHADNRNFHAWSYRRFVVAQLERLAPQAGNAASQNNTVSEFEYTTKMIKSNLSNFSAWHHRSKLIPRLLAEQDASKKARKDLFESELALICEAINTDPFDQSIWFYHQYLMSTLSPKCPSRDLIILDLTNADRQQYYENEMRYIREILEDEEDCKWVYEGLLHLACASLEVDGGTKSFTTNEMRSWLGQLKRLDPLRQGRWEDLGKRLDI